MFPLDKNWTNPLSNIKPSQIPANLPHIYNYIEFKIAMGRKSSLLHVSDSKKPTSHNFFILFFIKFFKPLLENLELM